MFSLWGENERGVIESMKKYHNKENCGRENKKLYTTENCREKEENVWWTNRESDNGYITIQSE